MTNGPVNVHLIFGPSLSTNIRNLDKMAEQTLTLITHNPSITYSFNFINQIPGHRMQQFPKNPSISHFPI